MDRELQLIVQDQALYFKNSVELKTDLEALTLPANASLFTYDAVAMYPSINIADCLARITNYLSKKGDLWQVWSLINSPVGGY